MPFATLSHRFRPALVLVFGLVFGQPLALSATVPPRVIVLGFDGADHALVAKGVAEGRLPNLAALAAKGGFTALTPTIPAQTPVSWSTFSTGLSPGRTLIFDFLKRNPKTYRPEFAIAEEGKKTFLLGKGNRVGRAGGARRAGVSARVGLLLKIFLRRRVDAAARGAAGTASGRSVARTASGASLLAALVAAGLFTFIGIRISSLLPSEIPWPINNRRGTPFWEEAGRKGISSVVMHVPVTFPAVDYDHGRLLSGLGVTDVRGRVGTPSYYTSDPFFAPKNKNEFSVELVRLESNKGTIETEVFGPYNKLFKEPAVIKTPMTLTVAADGGSLTIAPKGSRPSTLKVGEWSPWVVFTFPFNSIVKMTGIGRFHLASLSPEIKLYLSPIHFNPSDLPPSVKITAPAALSKKLADRYGLYKTMGWQIDTWSMSEETIDEKTFLEDVDHTVEPFRKMMNDFLDEKDVRLFVQIYEFPDRVAHCFWRFLDPQHPAYDAAKAAQWAPAVEKTYAQMDAIVGDAMKKAGPEDVLIVLSDHGFATWRRSVNYNTWLVENGFMTLKGGDGSQKADLEMLFGQGEFWPNVDWSKTKAYAMGLGDIYVNLKGREGQGMRLPRRRVRGRARRDQEEARDARGSENGTARRVAHLHARGGLRVVRRRRHTGPLRDEHGRHAHRLAGESRRRDEGDVRGQRADLVGGPLLPGPRRRAGHPLRESRDSEEQAAGNRGRSGHDLSRARGHAAREARRRAALLRRFAALVALLVLAGGTRAQEEAPPPAPPAAAEAPPPAERPAAALDVTERKAELAELRRRIAGLKARLGVSTRRAADLKAQMETAELDLEIQTAERRVLELKKADTEREAVRASSERDSAQKEVGGLREDLGVRLAALYRMGRLGYLRPLAAADSGQSFLAGLRILTHLARRDAALLERYETAVTTLGGREQDLADRRKELAALAVESRRKEAALLAARARRTTLLARLEENSQAAKVQVTNLEDKSERLAALLELLEGKGRALAPGAASIRKYRGALDWPLKGRVAVPFGRIANPRFPKTFLRSSGWTLDAPPGTDVHAVFSGDVVYAQWLKGYGNLVVVDHGDGVFSLYGRLATGTIARGERAAIGDRVGVLGESPEDEVAGLYFEIRDARASVDPALWLR